MRGPDEPDDEGLDESVWPVEVGGRWEPVVVVPVVGQLGLLDDETDETDGSS